jgi:hypothetical protein
VSSIETEAVKRIVFSVFGFHFYGWCFSTLKMEASRFLQNVGADLPDYSASHPRRLYGLGTDKFIMKVLCSRFHPNLVLGGTYSGQIVLWDNRVQKRTPIQRTPLSTSAHTVSCITLVIMIFCIRYLWLQLQITFLISRLFLFRVWFIGCHATDALRELSS